MHLFFHKVNGSGALNATASLHTLKPVNNSYQLMLCHIQTQ